MKYSLKQYRFEHLDSLRILQHFFRSHQCICLCLIHKTTSSCVIPLSSTYFSAVILKLHSRPKCKTTNCYYPQLKEEQGPNYEPPIINHRRREIKENLKLNMCFDTRWWEAGLDGWLFCFKWHIVRQQLSMDSKSINTELTWVGVSNCFVLFYISHSLWNIEIRSKDTR